MSSPSAMKLGRAGLAARTIYVKVTPGVLTFAERRAVLHALKQHGEIEVFKKLDTGKSSFISVTATESTATTLQQRSPIRYELVTESNRGSINSFLSNWSSSTISSPPKIFPSSATGEPGEEAAGDLMRREFILHVFPSPNYPHKEQIARSPLHGEWPKVPGQTTLMGSTFRASMPDGIAAEGLSDWETGDQFRPEALPSEQDSLFETVKERNHKEAEARFMRKRKADKIPLAMWGLAKAAKAGPAVKPLKKAQEDGS